MSYLDKKAITYEALTKKKVVRDEVTVVVLDNITQISPACHRWAALVMPYSVGFFAEEIAEIAKMLREVGRVRVYRSVYDLLLILDPKREH